MGKGKTLNIAYDKLIKIAQEINKNSIANRSRSKEEKIGTDTFIRQFGINRKDFSETIKYTALKYNPSTFLYDIPDLNNEGETFVANNIIVESEPIRDSETKNTTIVSPPSETIVVQSETLENNEGKTSVVLQDTALIEFEEMRIDLKEMLKWYKTQIQKENIIDIEIPQIHVDSERLKEAAITRGFKIYPSVVSDFKEFCKINSQFNLQDLMAMALLEYMEKYKKS